MADEENVGVEEDEESATPDTGGGGNSSPSKLIKILIYVAVGILVIFLMFGISYIVNKNMREKSYKQSQDIVIAPPPPPLSHFDLPSFAVTTSDADPHFVKLTISLGYEEDVEMNSEMIRRTVQMQHIINTLLRGKSYDDLDSVEDTVNLAEEIKSHLNTIMSKGKVREVYFREFVVN